MTINLPEIFPIVNHQLSNGTICLCVINGWFYTPLKLVIVWRTIAISGSALCLWKKTVSKCRQLLLSIVSLSMVFCVANDVPGMKPWWCFVGIVMSQRSTKHFVIDYVTFDILIFLLLRKLWTMCRARSMLLCIEVLWCHKRDKLLFSTSYWYFQSPELQKGDNMTSGFIRIHPTVSTLVYNYWSVYFFSGMLIKISIFCHLSLDLILIVAS